MSDRKEILLTQMRACRDEDGWFAPLSAALKGLTAEQAAEQGRESGNSVMGIVHHLVFWNDLYLRRFHHGTIPTPEISNAETFENDGAGTLVEKWDEVQNTLDSLLVQWEDAVLGCDEEKLDSRVQENREDSWWTVLSHLVIHNAYHIGQIVHIRKEQGSWQPWDE